MQSLHALRIPMLIGVLALGMLIGVFVAGTVVVGQNRSTTAADNENQRRLDELVAKDEIREQLYNYARGLDRMDKPLALSVWHPDATVRTPGGGEITGVEWIESAWRSHARIAAHSHQMTNALIHVDGDGAVSETYAMASLHAEPSSETANTTLYRVRYADRWSKRSGRWAMDHRAVIVDFTTSHDSTGPNSQWAGRRDTTDPSYQIYR